MNGQIDQRLISSAMLAALAEHDSADTLKIFETPIKICIFYTCQVGHIINDQDIISELDNRFTIQNMPLAVLYKICERMSKGKNKILESLQSNRYQLITDISFVAEEFQRQESITLEGITKIITKLRLWLNDTVPGFKGDEIYVSEVFDKFIKARGIDILFETDNLREDVAKNVGVENYQIGCFILHTKEEEKHLFSKMVEIIKGVMISSIIYLGTNEPDMFVKRRRMKEVDVYLDTTLLLYALNYKTYEQKNVADALLDLLRDNGARLHVFREHYNEMTDILRNFRDRDAYSLNSTQTLERLEKDNLSSVEIDTEINNLSQNLKKIGVDIVDTENYNMHGSFFNEDEFIDYKGLQKCLIKEIPSYSRSKRMLTNDVDAIASICLKRKGIRVEAIESCSAIFVTTNYRLAKVSNRFLKYNRYQLQISPVMGVMDITTLLWVKYGLSKPDLPMRQLVAIANAAVSPSQVVMNTFFDITRRLAEKGQITEDEAADMRYSAYTRAEIMHICGGNPDELDDTTVLSVRSRVKRKYLEEETIRAENAEKQLKDVYSQMNKATYCLNSYTSNIKQKIVDLRKNAKDKAERKAKKISKYIAIGINVIAILLAVISTLLVVYYGIKDAKGFVALTVALISGVSTIALWIPAFKAHAIIQKNIYCRLEPRLYERNLRRQQKEIDTLQEVLDNNIL